MSVPLKAEQTDFTKLHPGQHVIVRMHQMKGKTESTMHTVFLDTGQEAGYLRAHFRDPGQAFIWNARLSNGRWLYGVNDNEFLTVDEVLPQRGESHVPERDDGEYLFDRHLTRLRARRTR